MTVRTPGWGGAPRARAREHTRDTVVETALRLFNERGYLGVRVEDIAREAGVSRATFYKYFAEREEILAALLDRLLGADDATVPDADARSGRANTEDRIRAVARHTVEAMLEQRDLARFVYSLPVRHEALLSDDAPRTPAAFRRIHRIVEEGVAAGDVRDDLPVDRLCTHVHEALETAMRDWAAGRVEDPLELVDQLIDLAFHGVQAPKRRAGRGPTRLRS